MKALIKWRVSPVATGRYRSFEIRSWPQAEYADGQIAGSIECTDEYYPSLAKTGEHAELRLRIYDYSLGSQKRSMKFGKDGYKTLAEAKEALSKILAQHPEFIPTVTRAN
jgi:hypothetical protein